MLTIHDVLAIDNILGDYIVVKQLFRPEWQQRAKDDIFITYHLFARWGRTHRALEDALALTDLDSFELGEIFAQYVEILPCL